jgi:UDP-GlcNAc:undecaprenyl-phosphate/decaprenyl-phosphate GlcNAc-1-phosphate transferase
VNFQSYISSFSLPLWITTIVAFIMAFVITWYAIPSIVTIARMKNLTSVPNRRTSHINSTPVLGGIAIFVAFTLSVVVIAGNYFGTELRYIIAGLIIVFFIGMKDDILVIAPLKKLLGQILAAGLVSLLADIRITNLYGLFHITELPYIASIILTIFVFIVITNGFNLIDGIDGLASGTGILTTLVFGTWFWINGFRGYAILSFAFVGTLSAFFYFNVFDKKNKIFLGDTGSLLLGFTISVLACKFLQYELLTPVASHIVSAPTVVIGILILPLFDSFRVFVLRVHEGRSPFKADRQHLHHYLLSLGYTHKQATAILLTVNVGFIALSFTFSSLGIIWLLALILSIATSLAWMLVRKAEKKRATSINSVLNYFLIVKTLKRRKEIFDTETVRTQRSQVSKNPYEIYS